MSGWLLNEVVIVMKQEDKELLLRDICARLPYGIKIEVTYSKDSGSSLRARLCSEGINILDTNILWLFQQSEIYIKPYLFPLSSMTEEQYESLRESGILSNCSHSYEYVNPHIHGVSFIFKQFKTYSLELIKWLLKNHFDIYGLIPMDLAIDCTNLNIY